MLSVAQVPYIQTVEKIIEIPVAACLNTRYTAAHLQRFVCPGRRHTDRCYQSGAGAR